MAPDTAIIFDEINIVLLDFKIVDDVKKSAALIIGFTTTPLRKTGNFEAQYLLKSFFSYNLLYVKELQDDCVEMNTDEFLEFKGGIR